MLFRASIGSEHELSSAEGTMTGTTTSTVVPSLAPCLHLSLQPLTLHGERSCSITSPSFSPFSLLPGEQREKLEPGWSHPASQQLQQLQPFTLQGESCWMLQCETRGMEKLVSCNILYQYTCYVLVASLQIQSQKLPLLSLLSK